MRRKQGNQKKRHAGKTLFLLAAAPLLIAFDMVGPVTLDSGRMLANSLAFSIVTWFGLIGLVWWRKERWIMATRDHMGQMLWFAAGSAMGLAWLSYSLTSLLNQYTDDGQPVQYRIKVVSASSSRSTSVGTYHAVFRGWPNPMWREALDLPYSLFVNVEGREGKDVLVVVHPGRFGYDWIDSIVPAP